MFSRLQKRISPLFKFWNSPCHSPKPWGINAYHTSKFGFPLSLHLSERCRSPHRLSSPFKVKARVGNCNSFPHWWWVDQKGKNRTPDSPLFACSSFTSPFIPGGRTLPIGKFKDFLEMFSCLSTVRGWLGRPEYGREVAPLGQRRDSKMRVGLAGQWGEGRRK